MFQTWIHFLESLRQPVCGYRRLSPYARIPERKTDEAAGYDLTSIDACTLAPGARALIHTGICVQPPKGTHIEIRPRSGLALKAGVTVLNTPGTIDADYRGEIQVILLNTSREPFQIQPGDRIAQAVFMRHESVQWREIQAFTPSRRADHGFGSTGV